MRPNVSANTPLCSSALSLRRLTGPILVRSGLRTRAEPFLEPGTVVSVPLVQCGELEAHTSSLWRCCWIWLDSEDEVSMVEREEKAYHCIKYRTSVGSERHRRRRRSTYDIGSCPPSIRSRRYDRIHHAVTARRLQASDVRGCVDEPGHRASLRIGRPCVNGPQSSIF